MAAPVLTPIPAASAIVLRDAEPYEVLMMRRSARSSFVPDAWVFPGGAVEEIDRARAEGDLLNSMRYAAARELFEETGVSLGEPLDLEKLVWTSRWITPQGLPKRFDTYFFLTCVGRDVVAKADEREAVDIVWISPAAAIERGDFPIVFPTRKNLEALVGFRSAAELIESRRGVCVEPVEPVLVNGRPVLP
ncbi:MAG TPA: NUDIX hydrolase [Thermoanaerobaculia bacterium]|jgi:8-oxo-dGTP pyrophosphatase MutT (NUDIX family)